MNEAILLFLLVSFALVLVPQNIYKAYKQNGPFPNNTSSIYVNIVVWAWNIFAGTLIGLVIASFYTAIIGGVLGLLTLGLSVFS